MAAIAVHGRPRRQPSEPAPKRGIELTDEDIERILLRMGRKMRANGSQARQKLGHTPNKEVQK